MFWSDLGGRHLFVGRPLFSNHFLYLGSLRNPPFVPLGPCARAWGGGAKLIKVAHRASISILRYWTCEHITHSVCTIVYYSRAGVGMQLGPPRDPRVGSWVLGGASSVITIDSPSSTNQLDPSVAMFALKKQMFGRIQTVGEFWVYWVAFPSVCVVCCSVCGSNRWEGLTSGRMGAIH